VTHGDSPKPHYAVQLSTIFSHQASFEVGVSRSYQLRSTCFSQNFGLLLSPMIAGARRFRLCEQYWTDAHLCT